jgi:ABC-type branched-subunit amino acid transport system permease subunit
VGAHRLLYAADRASARAPGTILRLDRTLVAIVVAGSALAAVPLLHLPAFYESFLYLVFHWIVLATSWNILSGYSGYFSFGHGAFYGAGIYTTAVLAGRFDVPFLWTLPVAGAIAALLGVVLGAVAFRVRSLRGELFALLTLAVTFVLATIVLNTPIDGGPGVYLSAVAVPALAPTPSGTFYVLSLALATVTLFTARAIATAKLGLGLFAIHDDEDVAEVLGVPTYRYKLVAFGISCALAGVAGGIHALFVSYVTANGTFNITVPLTVVLMSVLGGTRHWAGPALGATAITLLLYASTAASCSFPTGCSACCAGVGRRAHRPRSPGSLSHRRRSRARRPRRLRVATTRSQKTHASRLRPRLQTGRRCSSCEGSPRRSRACARSTASMSTCATAKFSAYSDRTARASRR